MFGLWDRSGKSDSKLPVSYCWVNPGIKSRSPILQTDSLPAEPQRKPENTGESSLFLADVPDPGIERGSPALQAYSLPTELSGKPISNKRKKVSFMKLLKDEILGI